MICAFSHRLATLAELPELERLMDASIRTFIGARSGRARVEASFDIMGVDTQLVEDGTYFVVECGDRIAGCGGWSRRATMFGGDHSAGRDARLLDPAAEPARVRAMYTHPDFARRGVGRLVLSLCEAAAAREGFRFARTGCDRGRRAALPRVRLCPRRANRCADVKGRDGPVRPHDEVNCAVGRFMKRAIAWWLRLLLVGCRLRRPRPSVGSRQQKPSPPNVLLIQADDLGYGDLSAYGQARFETPALDRLAREGIRFTQYYAGSTVCAPSRAALMTGLHTGHAWIRGNGDIPLRPEDVTIAELLRKPATAPR